MEGLGERRLSGSLTLDRVRELLTGAVAAELGPRVGAELGPRPDHRPAWGRVAPSSAVWPP